MNIQHKRCLIVVMTTNADWNDYNRRYIEVLLGNIGIRCDRYLISNDRHEEEFHALLQSMPTLHERYDFVFTTNRFPTNFIKTAQGESPVDCYLQCQIPVLTWYVDNIAHHLAKMASKPLPQEIPLMADRSSIAAIRRAGITEQPKLFLPMWGPKRETSYLTGSSRSIPVIFTGDIHGITDRNILKQELRDAPLAAIEILQSVVEEMLDDTGNTDCFHLCIDRTLAAGIPEYAIPVFQVADRWLRAYRRKKLIMSIEKTPMVILGLITDPEIAAKENIEAHGRVNIGDGEPIMRQAKILLGDFANFVEGVELRPAMANVNGCVLACEPNKFMNQEVPSGSFVDLLSGDGSYDDILADALDDEDRLAEINHEAGLFYDEQLKKDIFSFS